MRVFIRSSSPLRSAHTRLAQRSLFTLVRAKDKAYRVFDDGHCTKLRPGIHFSSTLFANPIVVTNADKPNVLLRDVVFVCNDGALVKLNGAAQFQTDDTISSIIYLKQLIEQMDASTRNMIRRGLLNYSLDELKNGNDTLPPHGVLCQAINKCVELEGVVCVNANIDTLKIYKREEADVSFDKIRSFVCILIWMDFVDIVFRFPCW